MTVGINGYGFIGYHLWVYLNYKCEDINVIRLSRNLENDLDNLSKCNVIVHMAEKNRGYPSQLYKDNKDFITLFGTYSQDKDGTIEFGEVITIPKKWI